MAFKTAKQRKTVMAKKSKSGKKIKTSVTMPELPNIKPDPIANKDLQKSMPKMKIEKLKIPVGMNARPKWTDGVK